MLESPAGPLLVQSLGTLVHADDPVLPLSSYDAC